MARKLRTGRSRNDLVATEMRLYVKDATLQLERALAELLAALVSQARRHSKVILPGYTHLQPAQPILFSHYLLAYFEMFCRDGSRLRDCRVRADELPMGAGALAGTTFPINRERLAKELGFARVARNSLDVTSDRDPVAELLFACSLCMVHLSRWAEDLIIYSSPGVWLRGACRRLFHRQQPDAAEEESGFVGADSRPRGNSAGKPDVDAGGHEGLAARLRSRPSGRQGRDVRRSRHHTRALVKSPRVWPPPCASTPSA